MKRTFLSKRVRIILIAAVVLAVLIAVTSTMAGSGTTNLVQTLLSPVRSLTASAARSVERVYNYAYNYENLQAENTVLQEKIAAMEESMRAVDTLQRENERLRTLLGLAEEHEDYRFVSAYIISWESSNYTSAFTIGKGTNSGLSEGMCAVTENGQVVGLITDVGLNWATVTTLMDSSLEISVSIASSGYTGVVQGIYLPDGASVLRMNYLPTDAVVKNNDQVVTTGSTLYPRGLLLGYITNVSLDETGVAKYATLTPSCDLDALEQIFIITEYANQ